jgi:hypothetical protein
MGQAWRRSTSGAAALAAFLLATPATAASQGALGAASRGSVTITVSLRAPARIAGLSDFALDAAAQDICFRGAAHGYAVSASGSGPDGALSLSNGAERIGYRVHWTSSSGEGSGVSLSGGAPAKIRAVADPADCGRAPGAGRLGIAFDPADAERLRAGAPYSGTLLLTLAPE